MLLLPREMLLLRRRPVDDAHVKLVAVRLRVLPNVHDLPFPLLASKNSFRHNGRPQVKANTCVGGLLGPIGYVPQPEVHGRPRHGGLEPRECV